jgi:YVTN family beta-propeller protein
MRPPLRFAALYTFLTLAFSLASSAQNYAYLTSGAYKYVSVINTITTVISAVPVPLGSASRYVAITPDGTRAYIAAPAGGVVVVDTSTNRLAAKVKLTRGTYGVATTPDGSRAYVTNHHEGIVSVIDTSSNTVVATVSVGRTPDGIATTPDGNRAYVANLLSRCSSVIDTSTNTVVDNVSINFGCYVIAITPRIEPGRESTAQFTHPAENWDRTGRM